MKVLVRFCRRPVCTYRLDVPQNLSRPVVKDFSLDSGPISYSKAESSHDDDGVRPFSRADETGVGVEGPVIVLLDVHVTQTVP